MVRRETTQLTAFGVVIVVLMRTEGEAKFVTRELRSFSVIIAREKHDIESHGATHIEHMVYINVDAIHKREPVSSAKVSLVEALQRPKWSRPPGSVSLSVEFRPFGQATLDF